MEPTVLSGPLGHTQWESEQPFPLGFPILDSDNGAVLCQNKSDQTGLDFRKSDQNETVLLNGEEKRFVDKPVELENLINGAAFSSEDLKFDGGHLTYSDSSRGETAEGFDGIADYTLSWFLSPDFADVIGKTSACQEPGFTQDPTVEDSDGAPSSPFKVSESEINTTDPFLIDDSPSLTQKPLNPQSFGEKLIDLSFEEQEDLPPSQMGETASPDTSLKGLFPDQVADLPTSSSSPAQGLLESNISESFEGSVPLLDLKVPHFESDVSLCPPAFASVASAGVLDTPTKDSEVAQTTAAQNLPEQQGENDILHVDLSNGSSFLTLAPAEDACTQGNLTSENLPKAVMEAEEKHQGKHKSSTVEEVCEDDPWDLEPQETVHNRAAVSTKTQENEDDKPTGNNQLEDAHSHEEVPFDFSAQNTSLSSPEAEWTSEQPVVTVSLSKMVEDDSLPMVSAGNKREEDVSPLKDVFDALDQDGDGFVRIEEFMEFAAAYGADQVKDLTKFLDPSGLGVISFEDFHRGISAISGSPEPQLYSVNYSPGDGAVGCQEEYDEQNEVTDSAYLGSESTYSECETFTDEDTGALVPPEMHEDVETDSGIEATLHDPEDGGNGFSLNSDLHNNSLVTVIGGEEEHFEDFGESNNSELLESNVEESEVHLDSPLSQPPVQVNGSSVLSPSAPASLPDCFQSFLREEALDFFCSQCHKQISRLEDLSTRLNFLEMTSSGKRLSSKKVARHLLQNSSMTLDTMSDLTRDILELADNDITDKVLLLERRVAELEKESDASGEQHARLRQENLQLVHRANALEEQLKEQEVYAEEQLQQENRRHKEAISKLEREKGLELENLQARLQQLDEENSELRSCVPCLRANIERLEEEKRKLHDEAEVMSQRLEEETEARRKMADKLSHERHQNQKEKESTQELIEDLRKQLEHLQLYKLEAEAKRGRTPGAGLQEYQTRTREAELEQEIKRLKQDNRTLKEQNDELNGQIINLSIQGAKNLMSASFSDSLAAEINSVSRAELMETVHKQEEINYRLQDYIDKIIVAIMECNPSILEVK
ncbi:rab11 family-interacting protein 3 isoform X1 [Oryzias melastigma]|uniref:RAB11 family interacting protein 3 (class II) n=1 Tax=Oryzias melastigma TaxID=30732 RepID=A0A3B3CBN2_ORYME|nr:rab11 family-interacting protein 3 isoform X1 [Oryzias melastigma]XP_024141408.1 rab11 family-interacting protein 3 isoform X1 [Oryzias melastigma]